MLQEALAPSSAEPAGSVPAIALLPIRLHVRFGKTAPRGPRATEMWRGAFKAGLEAHAPAVLAALQAPEADEWSVDNVKGVQPQVAGKSSATPGYVFRVCHDHDTAALPDNEQWLQVTCFGRAVRHLPALLYTMLHAGERGIGSHSLTFEFIGLQRFTAQGWQAMRVPLPGQDLLGHLWQPDLRPAAATSNLDGGLIAPLRFLPLFFDTRLVLKERGLGVTRAPSLDVLVKNLIERTNRLGVMWGDGPVVDNSTRNDLMQAAQRAQLVPDYSTAVADGGRMSSNRRQAWVPSEGLVGQLTYSLPGSDLAMLLPWLRLGEWLHLGQQTSAGMGHYRVLG